MIGNVVGNYKVVAKIGEGGMGAVYKGVDLMLEREVAIKVLKPELASQPQVVERFRSEAVTLAKLNHPNIATLFNFFRQGDYFFMVMEYVNGTPLDKIIEACGVMTCEQAIPLFCQMLEGIDHAHAFGIVHRDIKPGNMMLTESGLLKVLDFGIARALGTARMTRAGHLIGTIEYMSPEQVRGMETDARSDIYSLGMVLYEMVTGRVPFASDSEFELMKAQVEQLPRPPREFVASIPAEVEWAILCATEKEPDKRFQTAAAFGGAIVDSVNTAVATGTLSQIDMRRPTAKLNSAVLTGDLLGSRVSGNSAPGFSKSNPAVFVETPAPAIDTTRATAPTRLATADNHTAAMPLKATRLGAASELNANATTPAEAEGVSSSQSSFLSNLSRTHYAIGATALGVFFLGLIVVVALFLRTGRSKAADADRSPQASSASEQSSPSYSQEKPQVESTEPQTGTERLADQPPASNQSTQEIQSVNPASSSTEQGPKINKSAKASTRQKPRRSSKDIMGVP